jgi:hypothetical protein
MVKPKQRIRMGDALAAISRRAGLEDEDFVVFERDKTPAEPIIFD